MDEFRELLSAEPANDLRKQRFAAIETFIHSNERTIHEEQRLSAGGLSGRLAETSAATDT